MWRITVPGSQKLTGFLLFDCLCDLCDLCGEKLVGEELRGGFYGLFSAACCSHTPRKAFLCARPGYLPSSLRIKIFASSPSPIIIIASGLKSQKSTPMTFRSITGSHETTHQS